jgi:hypothetical protein
MAISGGDADLYHLRSYLHRQFPKIWAKPGSRVITFCYGCKSQSACSTQGCVGPPEELNHGKAYDGPLGTANAD